MIKTNFIVASLIIITGCTGKNISIEMPNETNQRLESFARAKNDLRIGISKCKDMIMSCNIEPVINEEYENNIIDPDEDRELDRKVLTKLSNEIIFKDLRISRI